VENANKIWVCDNDREEPIGMIEIPPQDISSPGTQYHGETLSFSPWNCLKDHRPLGGLNRVRLMVYRTSKDVRHRLNGIR
jgi:hypothetical protein